MDRFNRDASPVNPSTWKSRGDVACRTIFPPPLQLLRARPEPNPEDEVQLPEHLARVDAETRCLQVAA